MRNWKTFESHAWFAFVYLANKKDCKSFFFVLGPCEGPLLLKEVENFGRILIQGLKIANFSKLGLCPHNFYTCHYSLCPKMIKNNQQPQKFFEVSHHTPQGDQVVFSILRRVCVWGQWWLLNFGWSFFGSQHVPIKFPIYCPTCSHYHFNLSHMLCPKYCLLEPTNIGELKL